MIRPAGSTPAAGLASAPHPPGGGFKGHRLSPISWLRAALLAALLAENRTVMAEPLPEPPPADPAVVAKWGRHIPRTMRLLETSRPERSNPLRILFYGQSIMGAQWHVHVVDELRRRYPHARIEAENRSIGGFASQWLIRTSEHDLYPFQPDLLVFHVYGSHTHYETIIQRVRARTTAEMMILSDHWTRQEGMKEPLELEGWSKFMEGFLRQVARRHGCEHVDVRWPWKAHLEAHGLKPADLLKDNVHLNEPGKRLMAALCLRQFVYHPDVADDGSVTEVPADADRQPWKDGRMRLEFHGNRVDLVPGGSGDAVVEVSIDGSSPGEYPALFAFTRPSGVIAPGWPALKKISWEKTPVPEEWTLTLTEIGPGHAWVRFRVEGSVTGSDGEGDSRERFVSRSGRVVVEPEDWTLQRSHEFSGEQARPGMTVTWSCVPRFLAQWRAPAVWDPTEPGVATLFHGLPNGPHTLELRVVSGTPPPIRAFRVHRPSGMEPPEPPPLTARGREAEQSP